ncbi:MAG: histidinol-phosphate transaminase [Kiritimatiellae bacterium]|nr:histidinol-phosphate transaminase [Kiritimatiellia bacterium]
MPSFSELADPAIAQLAVYEPGKPIGEVAREIGLASADAIIKLASNENALGPSPLALEAMRAAAAQMHVYPDGGAFYLRQALAEQLGVEPGQLLMTNGSNEGIELMAHVFLGPGTNIVMSERAFVVYRLIAAGARAETIAVPMQGFTHDLKRMLRAITPETKIVFVANPNNPTGTLVDEKAIARFMKDVPEHVVVAFDEAYVELLPPDQQPDTLQYVREGRNVVLLRTFSKTYGLAGLRIGYAVAPEACVNLLHRVRQPFNVNAMALAAAQAALRDEAHVEQTRKLVRDELAFYADSLAQARIAYVPSVANFLLAKVGDGRKVFEAMQREGVIVRPMDGYGLPEYVRITLGTRPQNEKCMAALVKVLREAG